MQLTQVEQCSTTWYQQNIKDESTSEETAIWWPPYPKDLHGPVGHKTIYDWIKYQDELKHDRESNEKSFRLNVKLK